MIFPVDKKALRTDLQAFLSLIEKRQARFDAAPDTPPPGDFYVNAQQRRLHPDVQTLRFRGSTVSPNGLLFCELQTETGPAAPFRPGQQARVYCGAVSYPVFFASAPADAAKGRYVLGVSADAQPDAYAYFKGLSARDPVFDATKRRNASASGPNWPRTASSNSATVLPMGDITSSVAVRPHIRGT